jgi:hypothetical protein
MQVRELEAEITELKEDSLQKGRQNITIENRESNQHSNEVEPEPLSRNAACITESSDESASSPSSSSLSNKFNPLLDLFSPALDKSSLAFSSLAMNVSNEVRASPMSDCQGYQIKHCKKCFQVNIHLTPDHASNCNWIHRS